MPRVRKQERELIDYYHFGINSKTFKVEQASQTRGGQLVMWRGDERVVRSAGKDAASECRYVFGWVEVRSMPVFSDTLQYRKGIEDELKVLAEKMKAES